MSMFSKIVAIAAITASSAALAGAQGVTSATKPFSLGLSGGASISSGDLSNYVNTGYNVGGHVALGTPTLPISFRGDVNYDNFGAKGSGNSNVHIWSYTANAVYEVPTATGIRPYIIGGVGVTIPLSWFNAFVEARYNHFNNNGGGSTAFIPITFGVMF